MPKIRQINQGSTIKETDLDDSPFFIGRAAGNAIQIDDSTISGRHAVITPLPSKYLDNYIEYHLEDLNSTNGTKVNGQPIKTHILCHGDLIQIGLHEFAFSHPETATLEATDIILPD
ncbi:MAG: FHA domain-containing protein [bacterium]